jgi:ammonia channel protein AmtB
MRFLIALVCCIVLIGILAKPLKRHPVPFYIVALALVGLYWFGTTTNTAGGMWPYFMPLMQRCALAFVLFTIVMFVGVLDVVLGFAVKACFKGSLRVSEAEEAQGLDVAAHGESAYPAYVGLD